MAADEKPEIPRKPKAASTQPTNGTASQNGKHVVEEVDMLQSNKRPHPDGTNGTAEPQAKKAKMAGSNGPAADDDVLVVDDGASGGAIVIDDD